MWLQKKKKHINLKLHKYVQIFFHAQTFIFARVISSSRWTLEFSVEIQKIIWWKFRVRVLCHVFYVPIGSHRVCRRLFVCSNRRLPAWAYKGEWRGWYRVTFRAIAFLSTKIACSLWNTGSPCISMYSRASTIINIVAEMKTSRRFLLSIHRTFATKSIFISYILPELFTISLAISHTSKRLLQLRYFNPVARLRALTFRPVEQRLELSDEVQNLHTCSFREIMCFLPPRVSVSTVYASRS